MLNHSKKIMLLLGLTAIAVCGCGNKNKNLVNSSLVNSEDGFGSDTAKIGQLKESKSFSASVTYPISTVIYAPYSGLVMKKIEVEYGDKVKKGDLLVSIQEINADTIAAQEDAIAKNLQELNKGIENYNSQIAVLNSSIASSDGTQQQLYQVQKDKVERQLEYYKQDGERVQNQMKQELETLKTLEGDMNIYAPYDGVIDEVENVPEGTELTNTRELLKMHSESETLLYVSEGASLKYNMPVTVSVGVGETQAEYSGRVVSADNVLDDAYQTKCTYVKLDENVAADELKNITVTADVKKLNNILLVKQFAVTEQNKEKYISIIEDGKIMKRPVITGGSDGNNVWILKGVNEGQQVLIQ